MDKLAYSIPEVVQLTGLSRDLLYDEMNAGRLAFRKIGQRRIITRQAIETFLAGESA
jgi:excisionase family DNA binding protein